MSITSVWHSVFVYSGFYMDSDQSFKEFLAPGGATVFSFSESLWSDGFGVLLICLASRRFGGMLFSLFVNK